MAMRQKKKNEHLNADSCSDDESENEAKPKISNCESGSVTDSHCGTNANCEFVDESTDQSELEVVDKTDLSVESDEGELKVNVDEKTETHCESEMQITEYVEETSDSSLERLNKSDSQSINDTVVLFEMGLFVRHRCYLLN